MAEKKPEKKKSYAEMSREERVTGKVPLEETVIPKYKPEKK